MRSLIAAALMLATAGVLAEAPADNEYPQSRALMRSILEQANDAALQAQKKYFPEHYDALTLQLTQWQRADGSREATEKLVNTSNQNWARYNELVRQGAPQDWRQLVRMRRDVFAVIAEREGAQLCMSYEYRGSQALTGGGREFYRPQISAYIAKFLEAAAAARDNPAQWEEAHAEDMGLLYDTARGSGTTEELLQALRPTAETHPQFCDAMIAILDAALVLEGPPAQRVWRFLVTVAPKPAEDASE